MHNAEASDRITSPEAQAGNPPAALGGLPPNVTRPTTLPHDVLLGILALVLMVFVAFGPALTGGFIWDDDFHLTENPNLETLQGLKAIWTTKASIYYPLVLTTFWVLRRLVGLAPLAYHCLNLLLHGGSALLFWAALRRLKVRSAWLGAALFAIHPIQVDTVAWITEIKNTQSTFLLFLALLAFLRFHAARQGTGKRSPGAGHWAWQAAAVALFALALLSKTSTVMFPVALLLCLWWLDGRWRRQWLGYVAPYFLLSALAAAWTVWGHMTHAGVSGSDWAETPPERFLIAGRIIGFYLAKIIWPHPLMFIYPRDAVAVSQPLAWLPLVAVLAVLGIFGRSRAGWSRAAWPAAVCYIVQLFPVLWFFPGYFTRYSYVADHFQYLAGLSVFALGGAILWRGPARPVTQWHTLSTATRARGLMVLVLLALLVALSRQHSRVYRSPESLWRDTLAKNPGAWLADYQLGVVLLDTGRGGEAIAHFRKALDRRPDENYIRVNLADALAATGDLDQAIAHYREAIRRDPKNTVAYVNLAGTLARMDRTTESIALYRQAVGIDPANAAARTNLGVTLAQQGRLDEATEQLLAAVRLEPDSAEAYFNLALAQAARGDTGAAADSFRTALRLRPDWAEAANQLAWTLATTESADARGANEAVRLAETICARTQLKHPRFLQTLAAARAQAGDFRRAVEAARSAIERARLAGNETLARDIETQLRLYEAGKPCRQQPSPAP